MISVGQRNSSRENKWSTINLEDKKLNLANLLKKKTIIVLGGNTTTDERTANGNAKIVESLLEGVDKDDYNLLSVDYMGTLIDEGKLILRDEKKPDLDYLFKKLLFPVLVAKSAGGEYELKKDKQLTNAFSNLIFVTHCAGNLALSHILQDLNTVLVNGGKTAEQVNNIMSSIQVLSYAPYVYLDCPVSATSITPFHDNLGTWRAVLEKMLEKKGASVYPQKLADEFNKNVKNYKPNGPLVAKKLSNVPYILTKSGTQIQIIPSSMKDGDQDHTFSRLAPAQEGTALNNAIRDCAKMTVAHYMQTGKDRKGADIGGLFDEFKATLQQSQQPQE